ncbi:MAG: DUF368 domain-containing protein [Treponema sp.]|nr:MAG: DUF368 domain-containing protein [Treponema sp.]
MISIALNIISGLFVGIANVIPGVSGGTIAVICGVYPRLLTVSSLNFSEIKKDWKNILALVFGIFFGFLAFAKVVNFFYTHYPVYTSCFFVGIILGSIPFLFRLIKTKQNIDSPLPKKILAFILGLGIMLLIFFGKIKYGNIQNEIITEMSLKIFAWLFMLGVISAVAMLIPGISGSFLLLILGGYASVVNAVANLQVLFIMPYFVGVVCALVIASKLLDKAIKKRPQILYSFIFGLVLGSALSVFPNKPQSFTISAVMILLGMAVVLIFTYLGKTKKEET